MTHRSTECPDFPGLRGDYRCRHNPPTGTMGTVPFLRVRGCLDSHGELWLETLKDGVWFPTGVPKWTFVTDDGVTVTRGPRYHFVGDVQT